MRKFDKNNPWLIAIIGGAIGAVLAGLLVGGIFYRKEQKQAQNIRQCRINFADSFLKAELPEEALEIYRDVLQNSPPGDKNYYAYIQNQTARCYLSLAKRGEEKKRNLIRAAVAFEESLRSFDGQITPDSLLAEIYLSATYWSLSWFQDAQANIAKSVKLFDDVKELYSAEIYYHSIVCAGISPGDDLFTMDSEFPVIEKDIRKAIQHGEETLNLCTIEKYPVAYALVKASLGFYYSKLANFGDEIENLNKSIEAFRESLKVFIADEYPLNYIDLHTNISLAYINLSDINDKGENLWQAIEALKTALGIADLESRPDRYAQVQKVLSLAYWKLSSIKDEEKNLIKAITSIKNALRVYKLDKDPLEYAQAKQQLGDLYLEISQIKEEEINITKAIGSFEEALGVYESTKATSESGSVLEMLGLLHLNLSRVKERKLNITRSIDYFEKALSLLNADSDPKSRKRIRSMLERVKKESEELKGK